MDVNFFFTVQLLSIMHYPNAEPTTLRGPAFGHFYSLKRRVRPTSSSYGTSGGFCGRCISAGLDPKIFGLNHEPHTELNG